MEEKYYHVVFLYRYSYQQLDLSMGIDEHSTHVYCPQDELSTVLAQYISTNPYSVVILECPKSEAHMCLKYNKGEKPHDQF